MWLARVRPHAQAGGRHHQLEEQVRRSPAQEREEIVAEALGRRGDARSTRRVGFAVLHFSARALGMLSPDYRNADEQSECKDQL